MIYAIPSYRRADNQDTLAYLHRMGVDAKDIYIFVQTEGDQRLYSERYGKECNVIYRAADCIPVARNNILNYFNGADNILMMDDDVSCISFGAKGRKFQEVKPGQFEKLVETLFKAAAAQRGYMFGLYPVYNEFFMSDDISTKVTVNTVLGFPKGFPLRFNEEYRAKEDIELCGRILCSGGRVIRFNNLAFKAKHRTNKGGAHDSWHSDANAKVSRNLALLYPDVFAVKANNPNEVRVVMRDERRPGLVW